MARWVKGIALVSTALCLIFSMLHGRFTAGIWLSLAITCGTTAYHFLMRLAVGHAIVRIMKNRADYTRPWFQVGPRETRFYNKLRVKHWKNRMPTYNPLLFSPDRHTWDEIAQAMCQAEIVHEIIVVFSFLPLLAARWWDSFGVFLLTSLCAAALDLSFVFMQRYNRPRVLRLARRERQKPSV